jgi:C4-type Zn-finger protein
MKRFNIKISCPKCGCKFIDYKFGYDNYTGKEIITRKCRACGYNWTELPLDSEESEK